MDPLTSSNSTVSAPPGVTGSYTGDSFALKSLIVLSAGLSIYNAIELLVLIFSTFSRYDTVYFWSLFASSLSLIPYSVGYCFKFFGTFSGNGRWASLSLLTIGWYVMVTGQSVVLWSRLHLVITGNHGTRILFYTKWMIIVDAFLLHIPTTVVTFGSFGDIDTANFVKAYDVVEKFQMTGFFIQETILSLIYIIATIRLLRESFRKKSRQHMYLLLVVNVAIIAMDVALLSIEYASLLIIETVLKGVFYSIKLKLEFAILGRLIKFVRSDPREDLDGASSATGGSFPHRQNEGSQFTSPVSNTDTGLSRNLESLDSYSDMEPYQCHFRSQKLIKTNGLPLKDLNTLQ